MTNLLHTDALTIHIGQARVCTQLTLALQAGDCVGVLGKNGSGKTTLLRSLAGLHPHDSGSISLHGKTIERFSLQSLATQRSLLLQEETTLFPGTVAQSVLTGRHPYLATWQQETTDDYAIVDQAMQTMDISHLRDRQLTTLSGGERRRVSIARLLAQQTDVMLLDEPLNHLDLHHQIALLHHLRQCSDAGRVIIFSSHDPSLVDRFCNHALLLFGNGEQQFGESSEILTEETLSRLYQHPVQLLSNDQQRIFVAR